MGAAAVAATALVYVILLSRVRRAEGGGAAEREGRWWLGYARDGVNLGGFLAFSGGYHLLGLPGPVALLAGGSLALVGYGLEYLFSHTLASPRALVGTAATLIVIALLSAAFGGPLDRGLRALLRGLF